MPRFVLVGDDFPAAQTLALLQKAATARVVMAFSRADHGGRKVHAMARTMGVEVHGSEELRDGEGLRRLHDTEFDWLININSTVLFPPEVLALPKAGAVNLHPGLLPRYAGLHPHQWSIRNGEQRSGVTIHHMVAKVDAGDIILQRTFPICPEDTGLSLFVKSMREGTAAMAQVIAWICAGRDLPRQPQDLKEYRVYRHRDALDGRVDWSTSAEAVERFVRAGNYAPLTSPSYTAHLDPLVVDGRETVIELLRVGIVAAPLPPGTPGTVLVREPPSPPVVLCGGGKGVTLAEGRVRGSGRTLDAASMRQLLRHGAVLRGRRADGPGA